MSIAKERQSICRKRSHVADVAYNLHNHLTQTRYTMAEPTQLPFLQALAIAENAMFGRGKSIMLYSPDGALLGQYSKAEVDAVDQRLLPVLSLLRAQYSPTFDTGSAHKLRASLIHWSTGPLLTITVDNTQHQLMDITRLELRGTQGNRHVFIEAQKYITREMAGGHQYAHMVFTEFYACTPQMLAPLYPGCCERLTIALELNMPLEEAAAYAFDKQFNVSETPVVLPESLSSSF